MIIFDLDGTLSDGTHRVHFLEQTPKDWESWHAACVDDLPNEPACLAYRALKLLGEEIEIWTGRSDIVRKETEAWLAKHLWVSPKIDFGEAPPADFWKCPLRMRQHGNYIEDTELKRSWLASLAEPPKLVFEDRLRMVEFWRGEGIPCFHVDWGEF